jgi:hypothetical protein
MLGLPRPLLAMLAAEVSVGQIKHRDCGPMPMLLSGNAMLAVSTVGSIEILTRRSIKLSAKIALKKSCDLRSGIDAGYN